MPECSARRAGATATATATASAFLAAPAHAVVFFTDRVQFEAASGALQTEDFQGFAVGDQSNPFLTTTGATVTCNNAGSFDACGSGFFLPEVVDDTIFRNSQDPNRPPPSGDLVLNVNAQSVGPIGATYTVSFSQPVVGFGFDLLAFDQIANGDILLTAGGFSTVITINDFDVAEQGFFGFVTEPGGAFDSFTLAAAPNTGGASIGIDDLAFFTTFAEAAEVSEPASTLSLLALGAVAALGVPRLRRGWGRVGRALREGRELG